jgi:hypothetical protein
MAEEKKAPAKVEEKKAADQGQAAELEALKKELEATKAKAAQAEEAALDKISKMVGLDPASIKAAEELSSAKEDLMEVNLGSQVVHVNGIEYKGIVRGPRNFIEGLVSLAGNARQRKLEEKIGKNNEVIALASGGISSRVVSLSSDSIGV